MVELTVNRSGALGLLRRLRQLRSPFQRL